MGEVATIRSGYLVLGCLFAAGCGAGLDDSEVDPSEATPASERREAHLGLGFCFAGNYQYYCDQSDPPAGTTTACCSTTGGVAYCCASGSTVCCPGPDTTQPHCCDAAHTCQVIGNVSTGYYYSYCIDATCGGNGFNGLTQCCSPVTNQPVPKMPITNLADCPNRVPDPLFNSSFNGCGTKQHPLPHSFGDVEFTPECNNHDICYDTCNSDKATCDETFVQAMKNDCNEVYGSMSVTGYWCIRAAGTLGSAAVKSSYGVAAYIAAQEEACQCCP